MASKGKKELSERIKDATRVASVEIIGEGSAAQTKLVHFKTSENMKGTAYSHDNGKTYKAFYDGVIHDLMEDDAVSAPKSESSTSTVNTANTPAQESGAAPDDEANNIILENDNGRVLVPTKQPIEKYNKGTLKMILRGVVNQYPDHRIVNKNIPEDLTIKENLMSK